ncbi:MAG: cation:proton antiporter [Cyanobacteria bacterium P01_G01_bin.38]
MIDSEFTLLLLALLVGSTIVIALLVKGVAMQLGLPAIVAYLLLGMGMQLVDVPGYFKHEIVQAVFGFLAELGIISLLFRVGLESNFAGLWRQLPQASLILIGDLLVSGPLGFGVAYYGLHWSLVTSLLVSVALMATSVGISVSVWQEANALKSLTGEILLDIAEMDDIAAIALMSLLFAMLPFFQGTLIGGIGPVLLKTLVVFCLRAIFFGAICLLFSRYLERPLTHFFEAVEPAPDPMLTVAGIGFITAAIAGFLGFSVAVGAFFAGLVFSRDPDAVTFDASFGTLAEFFVPFFFINIGLSLDVQVLPNAAGLGLLISGVAIAGKLMGNGLSAWLIVGRTRAVLLGVSMMPRAEIAMVIVQKGQSLGNNIMPPTVFGAMVMMSLLTCTVTPLCLRPLLHRWTTQRKLA